MLVEFNNRFVEVAGKEVSPKPPDPKKKKRIKGPMVEGAANMWSEMDKQLERYESLIAEILESLIIELRTLRQENKILRGGGTLPVPPSDPLGVNKLSETKSPSPHTSAWPSSTPPSSTPSTPPTPPSSVSGGTRPHRDSSPPSLLAASLFGSPIGGNVTTEDELRATIERMQQEADASKQREREFQAEINRLRGLTTDSPTPPGISTITPSPEDSKTSPLSRT